MAARYITYADPTFTKGYQAGFFACATQGNAITEQAIQGMLDFVQQDAEHHTPSWRTGYVTGWFAALFNMTSQTIAKPLAERKQPVHLQSIQGGKRA